MLEQWHTTVLQGTNVAELQKQKTKQKYYMLKNLNFVFKFEYKIFKKLKLEIICLILSAVHFFLK